jgi:hypothetical protein
MPRLLFFGLMLKHLFHRLLVLSSALALTLTAGAQELRQQATPFSVWLDFAALASPNPPKIALPIWLESLHSYATEDSAGVVTKTTFRLRFRPLGELTREMLFRIFFDDLKDHSPVVTGWSATNQQIFEYGPFGSALGLPSSATVALPLQGVTTVDIVVPGDGTTLRGAFLSSLRRSETRYPFDFATPNSLAEGFDNLPSIPPPVDDTLLFGRLRATLDTGVVVLTPRAVTTQTWEFELAAAPLLAVLGFEILNADPLSPLEVVVNDLPLGPSALRAPDLADPAYQSVIRPLDRGVQFRYAGWLQAQKAIPGSALHAGLNKIELRLPGASGPIAVRSLDLQLKGR